MAPKQPDIIIRKKDDVYLECFIVDRGIERQLSAYFTFEVPGYQFTPAYRARYWDGKIRLYNTKDHTIYCGLIDHIAQFAVEYGLDIQVEGRKSNMPGVDLNIPKSTIDKFMKALKPCSKGKELIVRDYQREAIDTGINKRRTLLISPTASGKSLVIYALTRFWLGLDQEKVLIVVPTINLVSQMGTDFLDYSNNKFKKFHQITAGVDKDTKKPVVITTWQSIYKQPKTWFKQFKSVIVDEVHHAQSKSIQSIMHKMVVCPNRVGLTGTIQDTKTHKLVLEGLFGTMKKVIKTKELIDSDTISDVKINVITANYPDADRKLCKNNNYMDEIDFLINHKKRLALVSSIALKAKGNSLVVFGRLEHGKRIFEMIKKNTDKKVLYISGETKKEDREAARALAEKSDVIIVASLQVFSTGINIKKLHNLIFSHPSKSKIKVLQSVGRVLRKSGDGQSATVYDIVDDLTWKKRENYTFKHGGERMKMYITEEFKYKLLKVKL